MSLQTPTSEPAILPTLSKPLQDRYLHVKGAAARAAAKHPDMDSSVYTEYLEDYLANAKDYITATESPNGPLHPTLVKDRIYEAEEKLGRDFHSKYPIYAATDATAREKEEAAKNYLALRRLDTEVHGEGIISKLVKTVYDEERTKEGKSAFKWANMAGMAGGALVGGLMGQSITASAGAMGGGWMMAVATGLLALSGAAFGSQIADRFSAPAAEPKEKSPETMYVKNKSVERDAPEKSKEEIRKIGEAAKDAVGNLDPATRQRLGSSGMEVDNPALAGTAPTLSTPAKRNDPSQTIPTVG